MASHRNHITMETKIFNQRGEATGSMELPSELFEVRMNRDLVQQVLRSYDANARHSIAHTKDRSELRGGGKKPWKQKGTGRARHASIRSPIWKGGGVAFGPTKFRNFSQKINKKMMQKALAMVLSSKVHDQELLMLDSIGLEEPKTKVMVAMLGAISSHLYQYRSSKRGKDSVLVVTPSKNRMIERAIKNLPHAAATSADSLNIKDMVKNKYLVLTKESIPVLQKRNGHI